MASMPTLTGDIITSDDPTYEQLRVAYARKGTPKYIVRCHEVADVQHALAYARANNLEVSVRSGGHSAQGFGTNDGGLVIDLSPLNAVEVTDEAQHIVRIEPGARWGDVAEQLGQHGLAISSGDSKGVGVGGLLLGGGIGWMVRKFGLTIDSLLAADIVTASGELLHVSANEHDDLFWAIRGGGGNFGIVTAFELKAQPVGDIFFGTLIFPTDNLAAVIDGWAAYMQTVAPNELTAIFNIPPAKPGEPARCMLAICYAGDDETACNKALEPLLALGAVSHTIKKMPYAQALIDVHLPDFSPTAKSRFVADWTPEFTQTLLAESEALGPKFMQLRAIGGAMGRVPQDATAFAHRNAKFLMMVAQFSPQRTPAYDELMAAIEPFTSGMYGGLASTTDPDDVPHIYPPKTYKRLAHIKRTYDPDNIFKNNFNIPPAAH